MASPNSTFTELVVTTHRKHQKEFADNVSNNNALLARIRKRGNMRTESGGRSIVEDLDYAENSTYQRYSGYDKLNVGASDVLSGAEYNWQQAAVHVTASGRELRINKGREAMKKLVKSRMKNARRTFMNNISQDIYSDGTASNQIGGLQLLVSDAGTGTVGGIDSSTYGFWASIVQSAAAPLQGGGAITPGSTTMHSLMNPLWLELTRGGDKPDLIVSSNDYFNFYWDGLQANQRYTEAGEATSGFNSLKYVSADVIHDGGTAHGSGIPAAHMYFLNTDYIHFVAHPDANMTASEENSSVNQDAVVIPILFQGNMTCSNRSLQGVLKA